MKATMPNGNRFGLLLKSLGIVFYRHFLRFYLVHPFSIAVYVQVSLFIATE